jgi:hemerythrin-like domain-containing protein
MEEFVDRFHHGKERASILPRNKKQGWFFRRHQKTPDRA